MTDEPADYAALEREVHARFDEQVAFLAALVDQPSCSREPDDVELAARMLDGFAEREGLEVRLREDPHGSANHRVYAPPGLLDDAPALALVGHIDTVFPRARGFLGFTRDGDIARGPGVLDMKSGLTAMFFAYAAVRGAADGRALPVRILVNTDEEIGSRGSRPLIAEIARHTTAALVFEAGRTEDRIVTRRKGVGSFRLTASGRAAHAGLAHADGVNAIAALAHGVLRAEAQTRAERGVTVNVGLVGGGTSSNTVPDEAWCTIDCRYIEPSDGPSLQRALETQLAEPLPVGLEAATLRLDGGLHRPPMVATEASLALMRRYGRHAAAAGLGAGEAPLQGGGSDANLFAASGVPSIDGLGPAGSGAHQLSEQCSLASLRARTVALARFLAEELPTIG